MTMTYVPPYSLPASGLLVTETGMFRIPFKVLTGHETGLRNFQHEEDDFGVSFELDVCKMDPAKIALRLVDETPDEFKIPGDLDVTGGNREVKFHAGTYLLLGRRNLSLDRVERQIILFVSHRGQTFQHFASNVMTSDMEVREAFDKLRSVKLRWQVVQRVEAPVTAFA